MQKTDQQIMQEIAEGNTSSAQLIFERYKGRILNFSFRILGVRADAEDVTGEVFLALFSGKYTFDSNAKFSTWLFTVARNSCFSLLRKRKKVSGLCSTNKDGETFEMQVEDSNDNSRETLEKKEEKGLVKLAISNLPFEQREAIVLREYHKLSYEEISVTLECSLENVKIQIFRAREHLRVQLSSFLKEESDE